MTSYTKSYAKSARLLDCILDFFAGLAGALMVLVMLLICAKVAMRYFWGTGIIGIDQISGTALLYITFLSAAWVLRQESHVTIDIVLTMLSPTARRRMNIIASLLCAMVCLTVAIFGALEVWQSWAREIRVASEIEILRAYNLAVIPLGSFLLFLQFLRRARNWDGDPLPSQEAS